MCFDFVNISFLVFIDNVGDVEVKGIDVDIMWLVIDNLVINVVFSVLDIELVSINFELEGIVVGVGSEFLYFVDFLGNISVCYFFELDGGKEGYVNVLFIYIGDCFVGMVMNVYVMEDVIWLIYGMDLGLKIKDEGDEFKGVIYLGVDGEIICGGCYI